jgi:hypothetical protein
MKGIGEGREATKQRESLASPPRTGWTNRTVSVGLHGRHVGSVLLSLGTRGLGRASQRVFGTWRSRAKSRPLTWPRLLASAVKPLRRDE